jgi:hypothetical protein
MIDTASLEEETALPFVVDNREAGASFNDWYDAHRDEYGWIGGLSRARAVGPGSGICLAIHRSEAPGSGAFWLLGRVQAKGGCRLGESNRAGEGRVLGSGRLGSVE